MRTDWHDRLQQLLDPLPTAEGGLAIVLATAGTPPALAMLSSGDVLVTPDVVRAGVFATSATVSRLGGAFSLLVPAESVALRVEVEDATANRSGDLALIEGRLTDVRPTAEPPWLVEMQFRPANPAAAAIPGHLAYWASVRAWLRDEGDAPRPPS